MTVRKRNSSPPVRPVGPNAAVCRDDLPHIEPRAHNARQPNTLTLSSEETMLLQSVYRRVLGQVETRGARIALEITRMLEAS